MGERGAELGEQAGNKHAGDRPVWNALFASRFHRKISSERAIREPTLPKHRLRTPAQCANDRLRTARMSSEELRVGPRGDGGSCSEFCAARQISALFTRPRGKRATQHELQRTHLRRLDWVRRCSEGNWRVFGAVGHHVSRLRALLMRWGLRIALVA